VSVPPADCRSTGTASVLISSPPGEDNDKWVWRWRFVPMTTQADFAIRPCHRLYALPACRPDAGAVAEATIPANAKWQVIRSTGYR
jgi:hypothetical protein